MTTKFPIYIILDNIRSALNVGAMFRTSDGAGVTKIFLCGITPYPPHNRIPKTALGAIEMVDWEYIKNTNEAIEKVKSLGATIVAVEIADNSIKYTDYNFTKPTALIFGNEINGVSEETLNKSNSSVYIPMYGEKESLNVATSFGILVYEIVRQWT
ncbi:MAG TPA: RNA methyltransferase [Candidatus Dojkabacteria bacterium]|jgi:tRNA G18 (ribose-2'-O)-methylase SpoU